MRSCTITSKEDLPKSTYTRIAALVAVLALICSAFVLVACNAGDDDTGSQTSLSGRYTLSALVIDGEDSLEALEAMGMPMDNIYLEFDEDGQYSMTLDAMGINESAQGTYTLEDGVLTLTADGTSIEGQVSGDEITLDDGMGIMTFTKD
jgi:hypothetical protein